MTTARNDSQVLENESGWLEAKVGKEKMKAPAIQQFYHVVVVVKIFHSSTRRDILILSGRESGSKAPVREHVATPKLSHGATGRWSGRTAFPRWSVGTRKP